MKRATYAGLTCAYRVTGAGRAVVLLHAGVSSNRQWLSVEEQLPGPFRWIVPDLLGFGETPAWIGPEPLSHDHNAGLVAAIIAAEAAGPVDLVGHSYGGAVALRLTALHPGHVKSLIVIEPIVTSLLKEVEDPLTEDGNHFAHRFIELASSGDTEAAWRHFFDGRGTPGRWAAFSDNSRTRFKRLTSETIAGFRANLNVRQTTYDCRRIDIPVTIVRGAQTAAWDIRIADILRSAIPHADFHIVADAGHMSPITHPVSVAQVIARHLARV